MAKPPKKPDDGKKAETRAHAEAAIAKTSDLDLLESARFAKHPNKHVRAKALAKVTRHK
jgi:hypothetical protein